MSMERTLGGEALHGGMEQFSGQGEIADYKLLYAGRSIPGLARDPESPNDTFLADPDSGLLLRKPSYNNEDATLVDRNGAFGVFDGVGGSAGGREASHIAKDAALGFLRQRDRTIPITHDDAIFNLQTAIEHAWEALVDHVEPMAVDDPRREMATAGTVGDIFIDTDGDLAIAVINLGDTHGLIGTPNEYLDGERTLLRETIDRSGPGGALNSAISADRPDMLDTRNVWTAKLKPGSRIVFDSDGVRGNDGRFSADMWEVVLAEPDPAKAASMLVANGQKRTQSTDQLYDDTTALVIDIEGGPQDAPSEADSDHPAKAALTIPEARAKYAQELAAQRCRSWDGRKSPRGSRITDAGHEYARAILEADEDERLSYIDELANLEYEIAENRLNAANNARLRNFYGWWRRQGGEKLLSRASIIGNLKRSLVLLPVTVPAGAAAVATGALVAPVAAAGATGAAIMAGVTRGLTRTMARLRVDSAANDRTAATARAEQNITTYDRTLGARNHDKATGYVVVDFAERQTRDEVLGNRRRMLGAVAVGATVGAVTGLGAHALVEHVPGVWHNLADRISRFRLRRAGGGSHPSGTTTTTAAPSTTVPHEIPHGPSTTTETTIPHSPTTTIPHEAPAPKVPAEAPHRIPHAPGRPEAGNQTDVLEVRPGKGFEDTLQDQYSLTDDQAHRAFEVIRGHVDGQPGTYHADVPGTNIPDVCISDPGNLRLNPKAAGGLQKYLERLGEDKALAA